MDERIRILLVSTNQLGIAHLKMGEEYNRIYQSIRIGAYRDSFLILSQPATTIFLLQTALEEHKPHIVHLSGHGKIGEGIILEDERGRVRPVEPSELTGLLSRHNYSIRVVFLNVCHTKQHAEAISNAFDYGIGMEGTIEDESALDLSASFYFGLASGRSVRTAFETARCVAGLTDSSAPILMCREGVDFDEPFLTQQRINYLTTNQVAASNAGSIRKANKEIPKSSARQNRLDPKKRRALALLVLPICITLLVGATLIWRQISLQKNAGKPLETASANVPTTTFTEGSHGSALNPDPHLPKKDDRGSIKAQNNLSKEKSMKTPTPEKGDAIDTRPKDFHKVLVQIDEIADGQSMRDGYIARSLSQKFSENNFRVVTKRSKLYGIVITGTVSTTPMNPTNGIYIAKANGMLRAVNITDGKVIATSNISDIRGFGQDQKEASSDALKEAGDKVIESFVRQVASVSH